MHFSKYNKIENTYRQKNIDLIYDQNLNDGEWEVSNKIHGANLSLWYDGEDFRIAKRSGFIAKNENFYHVNSIRNKLLDIAKKAWEKCQNEFGQFSQIAVYGELCGGLYPKIKAVQKGVYYSPELEFFVFDISLDQKYLNTEDRLRICDSQNIDYSSILFRGSFEDCLKFNPIFEDPIHLYLGYPQLKNNFSEGIVIKPCEPKFFANGSRVILKNKNPNFAEKAEKREPKRINLSEAVEKEIVNIEQFVTENKLKNILSKFGKVSNKDFGKILNEFNLDIMEDYMKDYGDFFNTLDKLDQKIVTKNLNTSAAKMIRNNLSNIIDGSF